jgi:hypothetical protein
MGENPPRPPVLLADIPMPAFITRTLNEVITNLRTNLGQDLQ